MNHDLESAAESRAPDGLGRAVVRAATPADAEGVIRMRSAYVLSTPLSEEWIRRCAVQLAHRLAPGGDARAFVIDDADGSPVSCALGLIQPVLPAPAYPRGLAARVHMIATRPDLRRRGCARAVVGALLDQLRDEHVTLFELHASEQAAPLYRAFGFAASPALMRMTRFGEPTTSTDTDKDDRPLQLHSVYSPAHPWQLVGGTMDAGERPWETAVRECLEETGLTVSGPPRLLATVHGLPGAEWPYSTVGTVFDGGRLSPAQISSVALDPYEHDELRVLPLPRWRALMPPRDFACLSAVAEARRTGRAAYFDAWDWGPAE
ncbi:GNAT family N-acetyltransferase [Streptomyces sp. LaBMicrA B280]|uniref:GNAT family N-acetyltransferase n=1 Tax=Streptomyces sp. LaBMicrA B280 TaxID=3391001 RepID=UPI003BA60848